VSQWAILCIRSLCSLPSLVICTVVSQVAVLPSYNSKATVSLQIVCQVAVFSSFTGNLHCCKSGCSAPFLQQWGHSQLTLLTACCNFISIYPNLFEFLLNLFEFIWILWNFSSECVKKAAWSVLSQQPSSHIRSCVHTRWGFHLGLWPFLNPLLILCY